MSYIPVMLLAFALALAVVIIGLLIKHSIKTLELAQERAGHLNVADQRFDRIKAEAELQAQTAADRQEMIEKLKARHEEQLAGVNGRVEVFRKQMEDRFAARQAQADEAVAIRNSLLQSCIPALLQIATLNADTEKGDRAARLLYVLNVLGAWTPDKSAARVVTRGQVVSQTNPAEIDKVIAKIREEAPAPAAATLKIAGSSC